MKTEASAQTVINLKIEGLKQQLIDAELDSKARIEALKQEITLNEQLKKDLEAKHVFNGWTPTKKSLISVIEMSDKQANLSLFKGLRYTSGISGIAHEDETLEFGDGWKIENNYRHGGGEGDGSEHYVVLKVTQNDINETFWMVPGYYESYNGSELELHSLYQVEPYERTVIDYRAI